MKSYAPDAGDVIWLDFEPQAGREQTKRRPALVLSPARYNAKTSLCLCCPITSKVKGYPFEVAIGGAAEGVVLADQIESLDWRARNAKPKAKASPSVLAEVRGKLVALLG